MRLFITKQSCGRLVVAGSISDEEVKLWDECDNSDDVLSIEIDNQFVKSSIDCDYWDGTAEELLNQFANDTVRWDEYKNSNEKFRYDRALLAIHYLERV